MERLRKMPCFVSNILCFFSSTLYYPPFWQVSSQKRSVAGYPKLKKRWLPQQQCSGKSSIPWVFFAILPLLNVEGIIHWMVLSAFFVYTAFIPYSSMQNACSLSHSCLILHPLSSMSMYKLSGHQSSLSSSPCGYQVIES